jgi:hypothetical protein
MRTRNSSNELLLVAILGISCWGCQQSTSGGNGSGGSQAGANGSGGSQAGGSTGNQAGGSQAGGSQAGGSTGSQAGGSGGGKTFDPTKPPCDIYEADGGPCVAAHSTVRLLRSKYEGPLYQVKKADGSTHDIGFIASSGLANAADQDTFCDVNACTISIIYDQSGNNNHLTKAPPGGQKTTADNEANAKSIPISLGGQKVYGEHNAVGVGYRNNDATKTASGDDPQTVYMVVSADYKNGGCCFDYGNAERNSRDNGEGTMEAVYFGTCTTWNKGGGNGPWIMGDLENGLWAGDYTPYPDNPSVPANYKFVTGLVKGEKKSTANPNGHWAIRYGDAQSGTLLKPFDGPRPNDKYNPMRKEGAIILGTGGDNSSSGQGNFFEGVMTAHYSSDAADDAVQANIVAAGYGPAN